MPRLIIPGDYQSQAVKFLPPDTAGLEYWGMFGGDAGRTARNHAPGKDAASVVGTLSYATHDATFSPGTNFVQTAAVQSADQTFIAVVRFPDDSAGVRPVIANGSSPSTTIAGNARGSALTLNSGSTAGDNLLTPTMDTSVISGGVDVAANATIANAVASAAWVCIAGRYTAATKAYKVLNLSSGAVGNSTNANPANIAASPFRIGANYNAPVALPFQIAMAAIYGVAKSDAEISAVYSKLKAYYAKRGMAI